jgi:hypothetical protein
VKIDRFFDDNTVETASRSSRSGGIIITYMTINKLSILTTASASLGTIAVINEKNDLGLTTRQGATFDDDDESITASLR